MPSTQTALLQDHETSLNTLQARISFKACELWSLLADSLPDAGQRSRLAGIMPALADLPGDDVAQGIALAVCYGPVRRLPEQR